MAKQTQEFTLAVFKTGNSIAQAAADGKINFADIAFFFDDIQAWEAGLEGFAPFNELADATNDDMDAIDATNAAELTAVPGDDQYDLVKLAGGILSGIRLVARKAKAVGRAEVIAELEAQGVDCSDVK